MVLYIESGTNRVVGGTQLECKKVCLRLGSALFRAHKSIGRPSNTWVGAVY